MKSSDVIKMKQGNNGKLDLSSAKVELILSDDSKYPSTGKIVFSNNYISSEAASLALKARFDNQNNILIPGDYVKVIVTAATPISRILVPQAAVRGDALNGYYIWCAQNNKTVKKKIEVSGSQDNHWVVENGLSSDDAVIVNANAYIEIEGMPIKEIKTSSN
jgi:membrane fusion protein (multidrug efflux system)